MKTNAARLLEALHVPYQAREYTISLEDLSAASVAEKIQFSIEQVFKTLLCRLDHGEYLFAVLPGDMELDLKKLASAAGGKSAELAALKDVEPLTGYRRGGVTVLGARKAFRAFADEALELFDQVSVSAGARGMQLLLTPADYLRASHARLADLTRPGSRPDMTP